MSQGMLGALILSAVGTFATRWLPLRWARRRDDSAAAAASPQAARWARWLAGVGPAAIGALFAVSAMGLVQGAGTVQWARTAALVAALAVVAAVRAWRGAGVALATLAGAAVYGALVGWALR